jgi:hypothetical protein
MAKLGACVQEWPEPFGDEAWLIGEHRTSREKKYYLANLPVRTLAATVKARWICEQAHQQLKEELGLDHFEGRSWSRSHDNDRLRRLATSSPRTSGAEKRINGSPPQPSLPAVRQAIVDLILRPPSQRCSYCRRRIRYSK